MCTVQSYRVHTAYYSHDPLLLQQQCFCERDTINLQCYERGAGRGIPRLQRLYMTEESAKQMTWNKHGRRYNPEKMVHPSDGEAWTHFDSIHHEKALEARNVRVAFATDGFNPYRMMVAPYTCWPVFVIPLNLPPGVCFQAQNIFLSLIIPGHGIIWVCIWRL